MKEYKTLRVSPEDEAECIQEMETFGWKLEDSREISRCPWEGNCLWWRTFRRIYARFYGIERQTAGDGSDADECRALFVHALLARSVFQKLSRDRALRTGILGDA